ncbi:uncharacterized protein LOC111116286 [Crassostrea virginica]
MVNESTETSSLDNDIDISTKQQLNEIVNDSTSALQILDYRQVALIYLNILVTANLILTLCFYLSWRKSRVVKPCASVPANNPQRERDNVYADIRESYFSSPEIRTYAAIKGSRKAKNTYKGLASFRRGRTEKWKTLTSLFRSHSHEVDDTVSKLEHEAPTSPSEDCL